MMIRPWNVPGGIMMTLKPCYLLKGQLPTVVQKAKTFMQDNVPFHAAKVSKEYLQQVGKAGGASLEFFRWDGNLVPLT